MTIFLNGKQKRVRRPTTIDGMDVDEFVRRNADPIWLHQNEMWEYLDDAESARTLTDRRENQSCERGIMTINFDCKKCGKEFDCDVGDITVSEESMRPVFGKVIICPRCGILTIDDVLLTELGQSQMTEATWNL